MMNYDIDVRAYSSKKIREFRLERKWTQKELGDKLNVAHNTVSGWEKGSSEPEQDQLFKMAWLFGVSINDLFPPTTKRQALSDEEQELVEGFQSLDLIDKGRLLERLQTLREQKKYTAQAEKEKMAETASAS